MTGTCPPGIPRSAKVRRSPGCSRVCQDKGGARVGVQNQVGGPFPWLAGCQPPKGFLSSQFSVTRSDIREHLQPSELRTVVVAQASCGGTGHSSYSRSPAGGPSRHQWGQVPSLLLLGSQRDPDDALQCPASSPCDYGVAGLRNPED